MPTYCVSRKLLAAALCTHLFDGPRNAGPDPLGRKDRLLKFEPGGDLDAMQPDLIEEVVVAFVPEVIVKEPGTRPRNRCCE